MLTDIAQNEAEEDSAGRVATETDNRMSLSLGGGV